MMTPERIKELIEYNPYTGEFFRKTSGKKIIPDSDEMTSLYDPAVPKTYKVKLDKVAWAIVYSEFPPEGMKIFHSNFQEDDYRLFNLAVKETSLVLKLKEAYRNIDYAIKIKPHKTDQFKYVLEWYENGVLRNKTVDDAVNAKQEILKLKLKFAKFLTTYCIFDE